MLVDALHNIELPINANEDVVSINLLWNISYVKAWQENLSYNQFTNEKTIGVNGSLGQFYTRNQRVKINSNLSNSIGVTIEIKFKCFTFIVNH
jgi:hypothetical protein